MSYHRGIITSLHSSLWRRKAEPPRRAFGRPMKIWKGRPINLLHQFSSTTEVSKPLNAVAPLLNHRLSAWLRFALERFIEPNRSNIHQPWFFGSFFIKKKELALRRQLRRMIMNWSTKFWWITKLKLGSHNGEIITSLLSSWWRWVRVVN